MCKLKGICPSHESTLIGSHVSDVQGKYIQSFLKMCRVSSVSCVMRMVSYNKKQIEKEVVLVVILSHESILIGSHVSDVQRKYDQSFVI